MKIIFKEGKISIPKYTNVEGSINEKINERHRWSILNKFLSRHPANNNLFR